MTTHSGGSVEDAILSHPNTSLVFSCKGLLARRVSPSFISIVFFAQLLAKHRTTFSLVSAWTGPDSCWPSDRTVTEVCFEIGYGSLGSFSSKFRAQFGRSPAEFQREVRRIFGYSAPWRVLMLPECFLQMWSGIEEQESRSVACLTTVILLREGETIMIPKNVTHDHLRS